MNEVKNSARNSTEMIAIPLIKLENLNAAVEQLKAGKLRPFMYTIHGPYLRRAVSVHPPVNVAQIKE